MSVYDKLKNKKRGLLYYIRAIRFPTTFDLERSIGSPRFCIRILIRIDGLLCVEFMKNIEVNRQLIAKCGLYCGACRKYISEKCLGCHKNESASWCKIRACVQSQGFNSCAGCNKDVTQCKIYSNLIGRIFAFLFKSDRPACIRYIREYGEQAFAEEMARRKCQTMKKH